MPLTYLSGVHSQPAAYVLQHLGTKTSSLCSPPQLLQSSAVFASATAYKDETRWRPEMGDVFNWMLDRVDDRTIVAAIDGRNPKIRLQLQTIVYELVKDETKHLDNYIMYKGKPSKADIRFPSRKVYGALSNVETVIGALPVSRVRMRKRVRDNLFGDILI